MAKKSESNDAPEGNRQEMIDLIARGEQLPGGWCIDFDHPDTVYHCSDEEQAVAAGDVSVSFDRSKVLDLASGEVTEREADFRRANPMGMVELGGGVPVASSPTGGGGRGPVASGGAAGGDVNG